LPDGKGLQIPPVILQPVLRLTLFDEDLLSTKLCEGLPEGRQYLSPAPLEIEENPLTPPGKRTDFRTETTVEAAEFGNLFVEAYRDTAGDLNISLEHEAMSLS